MSEGPGKSEFPREQGAGKKTEVRYIVEARAANLPVAFGGVLYGDKWARVPHEPRLMSYAEAQAARWQFLVGLEFSEVETRLVRIGVETTWKETALDARDFLLSDWAA